jgi:flagellar hook protein FlgE
MGFTQDASLANNASVSSDTAVAFNVLAGDNDTLEIVVDGNPATGGNPVSVTIPAGVHTAANLASAIESAANDALEAAGETGQVDVTYDENTSRFRVASTNLGANSSLQLDPGGLQRLVQDTLQMNDNTVNVGQGFQVEDPVDTSDYSTSLVAYDSLGNQHTVTFYFRKSSESDTASVWEWFAHVNDVDSASGQPEVQARGILTFNNNGVLTGESEPVFLTESGGFDFSGGAEEGQPVTISFGLGENTNVSTQFSAGSSTIFQTQDGYGSGSLQTVSVDPDGVVSGHFSNGQILYLAKVALANFTNPWGLFKTGGNLWQESRQSGQPITGTPGTAGLGKIAPNSLEQSNVDLAQEFVNMIINQRGFQANSRIITTTDDMLSELINLKR